MEDQKKSVLMLCVSFFGYEKRLADAIQNLDYDVDLYDERPNNGFVSKACIRYNILLYRPVIKRYYKRIIRKLQNKKYDYVFVVKGEAISEEIFSMLKAAYPQAKFVLYLWDSVANIPECEKRMKLYDRVLTFDPVDAKKYSIQYLPLPYDEKSFSYGICREYKYDVAFIGTAHSVRPRVVKQIQAVCQRQGRSCFVYFYSPHILVYLFNKLTNPNYRWITLREIHFKPLSEEQVNEIYANSRCVLDVEHPRQSGTTTRPVEMLPMQKKIITTNQSVKKYAFYNENNFCVIDREDVDINEEFWKSLYIPAEKSVIEEYSPEQFVEKLFQETYDVYGEV